MPLRPRVSGSWGPPRALSTTPMKKRWIGDDSEIAPSRNAAPATTTVRDALLVTAMATKIKKATQKTDEEIDSIQQHLNQHQEVVLGRLAHAD